MARRLTLAILCLAAPLALAAPAQADHFDRLLAPESVCQRQTEVDRPLWAQRRTMRCLHRYARRKAGRRILYGSRRLRRSALAKARDIRRCGSFSHTACGRDAFFWFDRVGYTRGSFGIAENLAFGSGEAGSPRTMMSAWLHSVGHRRALLDRDYRHVGFGLVRGSYEGFDRVQFWVAHFGYRE
jgi:uncharacterized protein YkwD